MGLVRIASVMGSMPFSVPRRYSARRSHLIFDASKRGPHVREFFGNTRNGRRAYGAQRTMAMDWVCGSVYVVLAVLAARP